MGQTGTGKTELVTLLNGAQFEIVSCDSRQVYRELEIGTAAPDESILKLIRHHVVCFLNPDEHINASLYVKKANHAIKEIIESNKTPVLVGGSGFYFRALKTGLFEADTPLEIRNSVREMDPEDRLNRLIELDPESLQSDRNGISEVGRIHPNDQYRISRALEVILSTGIRWSEHQRASREKTENENYIFKGWKLEIDREEHERKLMKRAVEMVEQGMLDETSRIIEKYGENCPGLKTLGYNFAVDVLKGKITRDRLAQELFVCHRQYGKRQRTWFRKEEGLEPIERADLRRKLELLNKSSRNI